MITERVSARRSSLSTTTVSLTGKIHGCQPLVSSSFISPPQGNLREQQSRDQRVLEQQVQSHRRWHLCYLRRKAPQGTHLDQLISSFTQRKCGRAGVHAYLMNSIHSFSTTMTITNQMTFLHSFPPFTREVFIHSSIHRGARSASTEGLFERVSKCMSACGRKDKEKEAT